MMAIKHITVFSQTCYETSENIAQIERLITITILKLIAFSFPHKRYNNAIEHIDDDYVMKEN